MTENIHSSGDAPAGLPDLQTFGGRLEHALSLNHISQRELARAVGVTPQAITKLCKITSSRTGSRRIPEIASFLRVPLDWLAYGFGAFPTEASMATQTAVISPVTLTAVSGRNRLTDLQTATLGKLEALMASGALDDMDCLELLTDLKPKLAALGLHR